MRIVFIAAIMAVGLMTSVCISNAEDNVTPTYPPIIEPGSAFGQPPSNAIILFNGKDFSQWKATDPNTIGWKIKHDYMEVAKSKTSQGIQTVRGFGDCQLHIEWATPAKAVGEGQGRGNSGVFLMSQYELQILDSYQNPTYPDGQAGAVYKQSAPLFNLCRKPGQWQAYDIIFRRPHFDDKGNVIKPATITALQNGVVIQDHFVLRGVTYHKGEPAYIAHSDKLPLMLQDHGNPTRFRNIWLIELPEEK